MRMVRRRPRTAICTNFSKLQQDNNNGYRIHSPPLSFAASFVLFTTECNLHAILHHVKRTAHLPLTMSTAGHGRKAMAGPREPPQGESGPERSAFDFPRRINVSRHSRIGTGSRLLEYTTSDRTFW